MKNLFLLFIVLNISANNLLGQKNEYKEPTLPFDSSTKQITYTKVINVNANKDSLYNKGKAWFYSYYKNPTGVIRMNDAQSGKITGKHQIKILNPPNKNGIQTMYGIVQYTITTQFKDNKTRIVINEINLRATSYTPIEKLLDKSSPSFTTKNYYYLEQIDNQMKATINNFEQFMTKPTVKMQEEW